MREEQEQALSCPERPTTRTSGASAAASDPPTGLGVCWLSSVGVKFTRLATRRASPSVTRGAGMGRWTWRWTFRWHRGAPLALSQPFLPVLRLGARSSVGKEVGVENSGKSRRREEEEETPDL